ncbi:MAG: hypothetical protein HYS27_14900 [Deltaproteobacteria bacterium]|nr:hypothetical protein [Deltaproteobacteria bacterium]
MQARLWLTVVLIVASGALVLVAGTSKLHEQVMAPYEVASNQSVNALNGLLTKHGAEAVDAATRAAVDAAVLAQLGKAEAPGPDVEAVLLGRAGQQGAPTFAALIKPDGSVAARVGAAVALPDSVAGMPEFAEAKAGLARDGAERLGDKLFHVAVAPAYDANGLAGVVLLGWAYDDGFADRLSQVTGLPAILVSGDQRFGSALKEITPTQLKVREPGGLGAADIAPLPAQLPLLVPERGRYLVSHVPVFFGEQGALQVFSVVDRNQAFVALAGAQAMVIVGTLVLMLLQSLLIWSTLRGVSKPIQLIVDHLGQASAGQTVGILPEAKLSGPFLRLGKQINMLLQAGPPMGRGGPALGTLGSAGMGPAVGPANQPVPTPALGSDLTLDRQHTPAVAAPLVPRLDTPGASGPSAPAASGAGSGLSGLFDDSGADPLAAFRVPQTTPQAPSSPPHSMPPSAPQHQAAQHQAAQHQAQQASAQQQGAQAAPQQGGALSPEATVMFQVPQELLQQSAQTIPPPRTATPQSDDARTVVAAVPQELLSQAGPRHDGLNSADEIHYREVYDKFLETRVQCREDTSDLTYDRFLAKLLKNRQQIVEKHKAKAVRFQVYVKEGKAALRALPVRE